MELSDEAFTVCGAINSGVMQYVKDPITGLPNIEFHNICPLLSRGMAGRHRVFWCCATGAAMADNLSAAHVSNTPMKILFLPIREGAIIDSFDGG
jgi:hypothetical protein